MPQLERARILHLPTQDIVAGLLNPYSRFAQAATTISLYDTLLQPRFRDASVRKAFQEYKKQNYVLVTEVNNGEIEGNTLPFQKLSFEAYHPERGEPDISKPSITLVATRSGDLNLTLHTKSGNNLTETYRKQSVGYARPSYALSGDNAIQRDTMLAIIDGLLHERERQIAQGFQEIGNRSLQMVRELPIGARPVDMTTSRGNVHITAEQDGQVLTFHPASGVGRRSHYMEALTVHSLVTPQAIESVLGSSEAQAVIRTRHLHLLEIRGRGSERIILAGNRDTNNPRKISWQIIDGPRQIDYQTFAQEALLSLDEIAGIEKRDGAILDKEIREAKRMKIQKDTQLPGILRKIPAFITKATPQNEQYFTHNQEIMLTDLLHHYGKDIDQQTRQYLQQYARRGYQLTINTLTNSLSLRAGSSHEPSITISRNESASQSEITYQPNQELQVRGPQRMTIPHEIGYLIPETQLSDIRDALELQGLVECAVLTREAVASIRARQLASVEESLLSLLLIPQNASEQTINKVVIEQANQTRLELTNHADARRENSIGIRFDWEQESNRSRGTVTLSHDYIPRIRYAIDRTGTHTRFTVMDNAQLTDAALREFQQFGQQTRHLYQKVRGESAIMPPPPAEPVQPRQTPERDSYDLDMLLIVNRAYIALFSKIGYTWNERTPQRIYSMEIQKPQKKDKKYPLIRANVLPNGLEATMTIIAPDNTTIICSGVRTDTKQPFKWKPTTAPDKAYQGTERKLSSLKEQMIIY